MRKFMYLLGILCCIFLCACGGGGAGQASTPTTSLDKLSEPEFTRQQALTAALEKYRSYAAHHEPAKGYPRTVDSATGQWVQTSINWTSGFLPGLLWQLAYIEQDEELLGLAKKWTLPLARAVHWPSHDIGFLIDSSFGKGARVTHDPAYDRVRIQAAHNLAARFSSQVGAIRSWDHEQRFVVIIDNMMNLSLLLDVAGQQGDNHLYNVSFEHMLTSARELIRNDGSSFHVVEFNEQTGSVIRKRTEQGKSDSSTWARGQAWGVYGFTVLARETGSKVALDTAKSMADWFVAHLPSDGVPNWDFDARGLPVAKDSSAASIAAVGLWLLSDLVTNEDAQRYRKSSTLLIDQLLTKKYLSVDGERSYLLRHATGHLPANSEVDTSLIYADYYFVEALMLQLGLITQPL